MILFKATMYGWYHEGDDPVDMMQQMSAMVCDRDDWFGLGLEKIEYVVEDSQAWHQSEDPDSHPYNQAGREDWLANHPELKEIKYRCD